MSKQSLLLVDGDTRSMRVLEVSLRKAGFTVTTAVSVTDALDKLALTAPDLIISETTFPDGEGFELPRRVRATPDWADIPFIFLTAEASIENKIRGLELGVDDYLTKPIYIKEIVTRINILLQKRQRLRFEERKDGHTRFAGRVADMPVVDVIQTIEISRKSGVIQFTGDRGRQATIYFRDGRVIDAEAGALQGEDAIYRLLTWNDGEFEVVFRTVRRREVIATSSQGLLMEGMRRLDEWSRILEQLPPLTHRFEVDAAELATRLGDVPDDNNSLLRLMDGKRTLLEVIDASDVGDLESLQAIARLYFEELLVDLDHGKGQKRDAGKPTPADQDVMSPLDDIASGPTAEHKLQQLEEQLDAEHAHAMERASDPNIERSSTSAAEPDGRVETDPDVIDEANVEPGALMGGYRQSGLRLIDEAVAAAQAIEPTLFTDEELAAGGVKKKGADKASAHRGNGAGAVPVETVDSSDSIPQEIPHEILPDASSRRRREHQASNGAPGQGRDESGLRMIGSLGRDRAEASGELMPPGAIVAATSETHRELVTILPRRVTREIPLADVAAPERTGRGSNPPPPPARKASLEAPAAGATSAAPVEPPEPPVVARTSSRPNMFEGSGVSRNNGPGLGPILLFIIAALLGTVAVWAWFQRTEGVEPRVAAVPEDVVEVRREVPSAVAAIDAGTAAAP
ncbi:MAG TPA: DUF4388 domain-containing protein, partial [Kofleriaceae bacterium]|nr:DUF4388 domain-containing protein [Kofleriaceae bacterium]